MGSSLAPILGERVIEDAVSVTLDKISCKPDFWFIYVDDDLTSIPRDAVDEVLRTLNSYDQNVKFTAEVQVDGRINFLDTTLIKEGDTVSSMWYSKSIASNRMLNYYSAHPRHTILNTARAFVRRTLRLTSARYRTEIIGRVRAILEKNNYPRNVIDKLFRVVTSAEASLNYSMNRTNHNGTRSANVTNDTTNSLEQCMKYSALTYIPHMSEAITRQLNYFIPDVKVSSRPPCKNGKFFANLKAKLDKKDKSGCVYKIQFDDCDKIYIGETQQKLGERMKQHTYDTAKKKTTMALCEHATSNGHTFDFDGTTILCRERTKQRLRLQEVNSIIRMENITSNFKTDSASINPTY